MTTDAAQVRRRRAAATRLRYIGTDCYDAADNILGAGPRPGQAEQLEQAAADLAAVARELSKLTSRAPGRKSGRQAGSGYPHEGAR